MDTLRSRSLRQQQHPLIRQLANRMEAIWHKHLQLHPYQPPADMGYVEGVLDHEKLTIENHCYQTRQFRKIHLELARVGDNLDILHCVMFPHSRFNLPIFGTDIVVGRGRVSAAIGDLSPVASTGLPPSYRQQLQEIETPHFSQPRDLPAWGDIFSDICLFVRPTSPSEEQQFLTWISRILTLHCQLGHVAQETSSIEQEAAILAGQQRYCRQQQKNDKTRRILEQAFGAAWAERYFQTMLFDCGEPAASQQAVARK